LRMRATPIEVSYIVASECLDQEVNRMARKKKKEKYTVPEVTLNIRTTLFFLFLFTLITTFLLAHVRLRFAIRDFRVETVRLQSQVGKMRNMEKKLVWEIEKLKQGDRLHEYACRDLGLVDIAAGDIEKIKVPARTVARYLKGGKKSGYEAAIWAEAKYPGGLKEEIGSIIEINRELSARENSLDAVWKKVSSRKKSRIKYRKKKSEKNLKIKK
jgi:cell division protein FtsB